MEVRSYYDLNRDIINTIDIIRQRGPYDLVVGIPRSGIFPAVMIALHLQTDYVDLYNFINGQKFLKHGEIKNIKAEEIKNILLVDDTVGRGDTFRKAVSTIKIVYPNINIIRYAVWHSNLTPSSEYDISAGMVNKPRIFEWNLWKKNAYSYGFDLDGVLCRDPTQHENDKGPELINFYKTAPLKFRSEATLGFIITNRLEQHREVTETWLKNNNIKYKQLIMKEDPKEPHIDHKIRKILKVNPDLFVESDVRQAEAINKKTRVPVWCIDNQKFYKV